MPRPLSISQSANLRVGLVSVSKSSGSRSRVSRVSQSSQSSQSSRRVSRVSQEESSQSSSSQSSVLRSSKKSRAESLSSIAEPRTSPDLPSVVRRFSLSFLRHHPPLIMVARSLPIVLFLFCFACRAAAFTPKLLHVHSSLHVPSKAATACPTCTCTTTGTRFTSAPGNFLLHMSSDGNKERDVMDEINFFKADIPPEIRAEIFEAEAKTQAGQERAGRLANYAAIVVFGLGTAIFNTFLTGLQEDGSTLAEAGFGWVQSNPINSFLFTSKIGGAIALVSAGLSAVMSEVEVSWHTSTYILDIRILCCIFLHVKCTEYSRG